MLPKYFFSERSASEMIHFVLFSSQWFERWANTHWNYLLAAVVCYDECYLLTFIRADASTFLHAQMLSLFTSHVFRVFAGEGPSLFSLHLCCSLRLNSTLWTTQFVLKSINPCLCERKNIHSRNMCFTSRVVCVIIGSFFYSHKFHKQRHDLRNLFLIVCLGTNFWRFPRELINAWFIFNNKPFNGWEF